MPYLLLARSYNHTIHYFCWSVPERPLELVTIITSSLKLHSLPLMNGRARGPRHGRQHLALVDIAFKIASKIADYSHIFKDVSDSLQAISISLPLLAHFLKEFEKRDSYKERVVHNVWEGCEIHRRNSAWKLRDSISAYGRKTQKSDESDLKCDM